MHWFLLFPLTSSLSHQHVVSLYLSSCVSPFELTDGREEGEGMEKEKEPNHTTT
jgi:hypothetical protein